MLANLFADVPLELPAELVTLLAQGARVRIERIVSRGHSTPPEQWYDQAWHEWVLLLCGAAQLRIEGRAELLALLPGDHLLLPAHVRHRVEWTDPAQDTLWLAVHFAP